MKSEDVPTEEHSTEDTLTPTATGEYTPLKRSLSRLSNGASRNDEVESQKRDGHPLHIHVPSTPETSEVALAALQYLPTPVIVLGALKTILVANEAMGRLLGLRDHAQVGPWGSEDTTTEILKGQTLSQIGLDMVSDGVPIWVSWEKFLDNLSASTTGEEHNTETSDEDSTSNSLHDRWHISQKLPSRERHHSSGRDKALIYDTVVDVVVSAQHLHHHHGAANRKHHNPKIPGPQTHCRMIISTWWIDEQQFYTLSFTSAAQPKKQHVSSHVVSRVVPSTSRSSHSSLPTSSRSSSFVTSPSEAALAKSAFPPHGAPAKCIVPSAPSAVTDFQKVTRMKDAMLGAMHIPVIAMWRDESAVFPNQAARRLLEVTADPTSEESYDFMSRFKAYTSDFERELLEEENPIIKLCRTQKAFEKWEIGLINERTGKRSTYDVSGYPFFDDKSGEFFAGLVTFKDVSYYTEKLATQIQENDQKFQLICNSLPEMLWTTLPDGYHDWFSERWYTYTGLTPDECRGFNWQSPFHPEDMPQSLMKWQHSLDTGDEYLTEYRCRRHDGKWRWMLGRALPLRDNKTGKIIKWHGSCTDIQETVDARNTGKRAREQLLEVLKHSELTMWTINRESVITFYEGDIVPDVGPEEVKARSEGVSIFEAFKGLGGPKLVSELKASIKRIFDGESQLELYENSWDNRWFRSRLVPLTGRKGAGGVEDANFVEGAVGISQEVTQLVQKEHENIVLLANAAAAKEASKMKSNFLANMSHEIRTPIAGVLGLTELLMDTKLDKEQADFATNIQRSANSLLTVINDILDFSKIESGRLDIEEVQFSLCVVLKDVAKMLSFAAERKGLKFVSETQLEDGHDLVLLGDPGRVRQILTNLLTNSIKFTSDGGNVKLSAHILKDASDTATVRFQVADSGIGIEEEVKKRLFKPFSQADSSTARRFGGTGLGLTICKNLVELMHGTISLESKLDQGTLATFTIPFKKPEYATGSTSPLVNISALPDRLQSELSLSNMSSRASISRGHHDSQKPGSPTSIVPASVRASPGSPGHGSVSAPAALNDSQRQQFHILVVEDNPVNQQIALKFIKSLKFSTNAVWNGKEALEYLTNAVKASNLSPAAANQWPLPSVILMDVQMPVLDGYRCTHMLRYHAPYNTMDAIQKIPIIAMTASAIQGDREKCERAGMDDYLAKPVKRTTLEKMLLKWLTGEGKLKPGRKFDVEGNRPDLTRSGTLETDHSSDCPGTDDVASNDSDSFLHVPRLNPVNTYKVGQPSMNKPLPTPIQQHPAQSGRGSSLSRSFYAPELPGGESEGDRGLRRAAAEELASSLRDAKLLAATEPEHGSPADSGLRSSSFGTATTGSLAGSHLPRSYPEQGDSEHQDGVLALTLANVKKLNAEQEEAEHLSSPPTADLSRISSLVDTGVATGMYDGMSQDLFVGDVPSPPAITVSEAAPIQNAELSAPDSPENIKRDRLAAMRRQSSDWSSSTVKPANP